MGKFNVREIAESIAENPAEWVLVVGDILPYTKKESKKHQIAKMIKKEIGIYGNSALHQSIEDQDYVGIANRLFGSGWNGTSFLERERREQMRRRETFASGFASRENVNIEVVKTDMDKLLKVFPGMILSICQNEVLEAFLENEQSISIEDIVWTPHDMMSSPKWAKWYESKREASSKEMGIAPENIDINGRMLVKLYGSCGQPHQMLLSEQDFELYYPVDENEKSCVKFFLQEIFLNKKVIFLGTDLIYSTNQNKSKRMPFAPGISKLLENTKEKEKSRYIYPGNDKLKLEWKNYGLQKIHCDTGIDGLIQTMWEIFESKQQINTSIQICTDDKNSEDDENSTLELREDEAKGLFWELYSRRTKSHVPQREKDILLKDILRLEEKLNKWSKKSISLLAVVANRQADFYDLKTEWDWAVNNLGDKIDKGGTEFYECLLEEMLRLKLSSKSQEMLRILSFYGDGFPAGFLALVLKDDEDLNEWKKAGIQLVNSGIYIQRRYRRRLHRRMEYADAILKTAGTNLNKRQFASIIEEVGRLMDDSYFYPLDSNYFSIEIKDEDKARFEEMFKKLLLILENRPEGYGHIYSLLESETPVIVEKIEEIDDKEMQWKPALLYYLLRENSLPDNIREKVRKQLELLLNDMDDLGKNVNVLCGKMMLLQTWGIIESQSSEIQKQEDALRKCEEAEAVLEEAEMYEKNNGAVIISETLFIQKMHICFQKCRIYARISTIAEIIRCKKKGKSCVVQATALNNMKEQLKKSKVFLQERECVVGYHCKEMWAEWSCYEGEYWFKISQYHKEHREWVSAGKSTFQEEMKIYDKAESSYKQALNYYESYPHRYWMQCAWVERNLADLYCWKSKIMKETTDRERREKIMYRNKCYDMLAAAYLLYRSHADLHGIADVLQSMGNAEDFSRFDLSVERDKRSSFCFYNVSKELYDLLGDRWSTYVVMSFKEGAVNARKKIFENG